MSVPPCTWPFADDRWAWPPAADAEEGRVAREVAHAAGRISRQGRRPRVLDLGCGTGAHAVGLALEGFDVVGVDVCAPALEQAGERAGRAGVSVAWQRVDLLRDPAGTWPDCDAVIALRLLGETGETADDRRLLAAVRERLPAGGLLLLDHANLTGQPQAGTATHRSPDGTVHERVHDYDPLTGRRRTTVRSHGPDGRTRVFHRETRLYQPADVHALLRAAGFEVEAVDADFTAGARPGARTRRVQFTASRRAASPIGLAVRSYESPAPAAGLLDLRWSPDEVDFVRPDIDRVWRELAGRGLREVAEESRRYHVDDPFGAAEAADVLSGHHGHRIEPHRVTFGAGVTSLLHGLAGLAGERMCAAPWAHPDLPAWAHRSGAELLPTVPTADGVPTPDGAGEWDHTVAAVRRHRPALVLIDRPDIRGRLPTAEDVRRVAREAAAYGGIVVVDEAQATYLGPRGSVVALTGALDNLVVLRSLSKGYCSGGLRVGYAIAAPATTRRLREALPPLGVSALAFRVALELLSRGDVFGPLRQRVAAVKPAVAGALRDDGLEVDAGHPELPWVVSTAPHDRTRPPLETRGIRAKHLTFGFPGTPRLELTKIAVPLSAERLRRFQEAYPMGDRPDDGTPAAGPAR